MAAKIENAYYTAEDANKEPREKVRAQNQESKDRIAEAAAKREQAFKEFSTVFEEVKDNMEPDLRLSTADYAANAAADEAEELEAQQA